MILLRRYELIYSLCRCADVISVDIFDTLIFRDVTDPKDVFQIVDSVYRGMAEDRTIEYDDVLLKCEKNIAHPNLELLEIIRRLKNEGKRIVLTSDMYLSEKSLEELLEEVGIRKTEDYFKIFVSSEYNCEKRNGELFKIVRDSCEANSYIVHIGDRIRSDYIMPKTQKIHSIWIRKRKNGFYPGIRHSELSNLNAFIDNHIKNENYEYSLGYKCFGPLVFGFVNWIAEQFDSNDTKAFFLAREGDVFLRALELINARKTNMSYMLVSRRSLSFALMWTAEGVDGILRLLKIDRSIRFEKIAFLLHLEDELNNYNAKGTLKDRVFSNTKSIMEDKDAFTFLNNHLIAIKEKSKKQFDAMDAYLDSIGFLDSEACSIVDIGWVGTMQKLLNRYLEIKHIDKRLNGLYMGVSEHSYVNLDMRGFLFGNSNYRYQKDIFSFVGLLESVLSEACGSVKGYDTISGRICVNRCQYEYQKESLTAISLVKKGMYHFIQDMQNSVLKNILCFDPFLSSYNIIRFGNYPSERDLQFYKQLVYSDDSYDMGKSNKEKRDLKTIKGNAMNSIWKIAFLKCEFCKMVPAKMIYDFMYSIHKRR